MNNVEWAQWYGDPALRWPPRCVCGQRTRSAPELVDLLTASRHSLLGCLGRSTVTRSTSVHVFSVFVHTHITTTTDTQRHRMTMPRIWSAFWHSPRQVHLIQHSAQRNICTPIRFSHQLNDMRSFRQVYIFGVPVFTAQNLYLHADHTTITSVTTVMTTTLVCSWTALSCFLSVSHACVCVFAKQSRIDYFRRCCACFLALNPLHKGDSSYFHCLHSQMTLCFTRHTGIVFKCFYSLHWRVTKVLSVALYIPFNTSLQSLSLPL